MRKNDAQIGKPSILYKDAKSNIEALSGIESGATAYATGTKELGCYDGTQWVWVSPSDIDNFDVQGGTGTLIFPASGAYTLTIPATTGLREMLTANRTYYVRTDGDDSHTGLVNSAAGAFLTVQKAVDTIANTLDIAGKTVTVQIGDGTYTGAVTLKNIVGFAEAGNLIIQGNNGTPSNVIISTTSATCFSSDGLSTAWDIKDLKVETTTSGNGLSAQRGSLIRYGNLVFGACAGNHIIITQTAKILALSNYSISGGAVRHFYASSGGYIVCQNFTITLTADMSFTTAFAGAIVASSIINNGCTYSLGGHSITGKRYSATENSVIYTGGGGASYYPGDSAGSTDTGGQYV